MQKDSVVVVFKMLKRNKTVHLDIPLYITANELTIALNSAYGLGIDVTNIKECYFKSENPIALLKGNKKMSEFGLRNGSIIYFTE